MIEYASHSWPWHAAWASLGCARNAPKRRKVSRGFWKSMPGPKDESSEMVISSWMVWNLPSFYPHMESSPWRREISPATNSESVKPWGFQAPNPLVNLHFPLWNSICLMGISPMFRNKKTSDIRWKLYRATGILDIPSISPWKSHEISSNSTLRSELWRSNWLCWCTRTASALAATLDPWLGGWSYLKLMENHLQIGKIFEEYRFSNGIYIYIYMHVCVCACVFARRDSVLIGDTLW